MTTEPESPRRGPAEPESPDQLPPPVEADEGVRLPPLLGKRPRVDPYKAHYSRVQRRRDKIRAEIERNRAGEPSIPTWVLALILVVLVGGLAAIVIFA